MSNERMREFPALILAPQAAAMICAFSSVLSLFYALINPSGYQWSSKNHGKVTAMVLSPSCITCRRFLILRSGFWLLDLPVILNCRSVIFHTYGRYLCLPVQNAPFFYKKRKRTQRTPRSFIKNAKERNKNDKSCKKRM